MPRMIKYLNQFEKISRGKKRTSVLLKYRSTKKYRDVPRSTKKSQESQGSTETTTKYRKVQGSTEVQRSTETS